MADRRVLTGRIHALKDQKQRVSILRVQPFLECVETREALLQVRSRFVFIAEWPRVVRIVALQSGSIARPNAESLDAHAQW
jgi:hypothetical protein